MVTCQICGKEFEDNNYLSAHLKFQEHITSKDYYDKYFKQPNEGICIVCGKETKYHNIVKGYSLCCSRDCANKEKGIKISDKKQSYTDEQKQKIKSKREITCLEKYGFKSNLQISEIIEKNHTKEIRQKAIATCEKHMLDGTIKGQNVEQSWKTRHNKIQQYCKEHKTKLIEIPYTQKNNIDNILKKELKIK